MTEQKFWKTVRRHSRQYAQIIDELQRLDDFWPKLEALMEAAAKAGELTHKDCLAVIAFTEFLRDCDCWHSRLLRLQRGMHEHLALAPPEVKQLAPEMERRP